MSLEVKDVYCIKTGRTIFITSSDNGRTWRMPDGTLTPFVGEPGSLVRTQDMSGFAAGLIVVLMGFLVYLLYNLP